MQFKLKAISSGVVIGETPVSIGEYLVFLDTEDILTNEVAICECAAINISTLFSELSIQYYVDDVLKTERDFWDDHNTFISKLDVLESTVPPVFASLAAQEDTGSLLKTIYTELSSGVTLWAGASFTVNSVPMSCSGSCLISSGVSADVDGNLSGLRSVLFASVVDNGNSDSAETVDFSSGQKQKITLNAEEVTLTLVYPGIGEYVLELIQDVTTVCSSLIIANSPLYPGGSLEVKATAGSRTLLSIYYDGSVAVIASTPDIKTGTVSIS